jgi:hypothetical protein
MTASRDTDRLVQAFLEEGPAVLPDRVLEAVQDDVHEMRQRATTGPWRTFTMARTFLAAAAVVALAIGGFAIWANLPGSNEPGGGPTPTPAPTASPTPEPEYVGGALTAGTTYQTLQFGEAFTFVLPERLGSQEVDSDVWDQRTFRIRPASGGAITFHDDARLTDDICHPTGVLPDHPATPEAVGEWLRASEGLTISEPTEMTVDGVTAMYYDIQLAETCEINGDPMPGAPTVWFDVNERHRVYAVPSGDDLVIVFTWGAGYQGIGDEVLDDLNLVTDDLVRSIVFD